MQSKLNFNESEIENLCGELLCCGGLTIYEDIGNRYEDIGNRCVVAKLGSEIGRHPMKAGWQDAVDPAVRALALAILTRRATGITPKENLVSYVYH